MSIGDNKGGDGDAMLARALAVEPKLLNCLGLAIGLMFAQSVSASVGNWKGTSEAEKGV